MDIQSILAIVFLIGLSIVLYLERKNLTMQKIAFPLLYFVMWKTQIGLKFMDSFARKFSKPLKYLGYIGVGVGFLGMFLIAEELLRTIYTMFSAPETIQGVGLVLPFEVKGAFYVPFFYWIISIFVLAIIHEYSHGIMARRIGIKLKSTGLAFVGIIIPVLPAAFVEPDETELEKASKIDQLSVFAAGPFSNILFAFIFLGLLIGLSAPASNLMDFNGVEISDFTEDSTALAAGLEEGDIITHADNVQVQYVHNFTDFLSQKKPGENVVFKTNEKTYNVVLGENPQNKSKPYVGVFVGQHRDLKESIVNKYGRIIPGIALWFLGLLYWLYLLNFGIGLFNLIPIGPVDGGRMLRVALLRFFKKDLALRIWRDISIFFLVLLLSVIVAGFIR